MAISAATFVSPYQTWLLKLAVQSLKIHFSIMLSSSPGFQIFLYSCYFSSGTSFPVCTLPAMCPASWSKFHLNRAKVKMTEHFVRFQVLTAVLKTIKSSEWTPFPFVHNFWRFGGKWYLRNVERYFASRRGLTFHNTCIFCASGALDYAFISC